MLTFPVHDHKVPATRVFKKKSIRARSIRLQHYVSARCLLPPPFRHYTRKPVTTWIETYLAADVARILELECMILMPVTVYVGVDAA